MPQQFWRFRKYFTSGVSIKWAQSAIFNILATLKMPPINELGGCVLMLSLLSPLFISQQIVKTHQKGCWSTMFSSFWRASIQSFCFQVRLVFRWFRERFKQRETSSGPSPNLQKQSQLIIKAMSFNCFSYSQVKILLFGRVKMVKAT